MRSPLGWDGRWEPAVAELRGFRWWRAGRRGWLYSPWMMNYRWTNGPNVASCAKGRGIKGRILRGGHDVGEVPLLGCRCGFYAMYELPEPSEHPYFAWNQSALTSGTERLVFGVARAAGRVLLGERGWRAETADIQALFVGPRLGRTLRGAVDRYRVPVFRDLDRFVREWGPDGTAKGLLRSA